MNDIELKRVVKHAAAVHGVSTREVVDAVLGREQPGLKRSHKGLWITMSCVGVVFVGGLIWLLNYLNAPAVAGPTPSTSLEQVRKSVAPTPSVLPTFGGKTVSFTYPAQFDAVTQLKDDQRAVEAYTISSKADYRRVIQLAVRPLPSGNLDDESGYKLRKLKTDDYRSAAVNVMNEPAVLMTKLDGLEQSLFWVHQGTVVEIAILSSTQTDDIAGYMTTVRESLKWRQ